MILTLTILSEYSVLYNFFKILINFKHKIKLLVLSIKLFAHINLFKTEDMSISLRNSITSYTVLKINGLQLHLNLDIFRRCIVAAVVITPIRIPTKKLPAPTAIVSVVSGLV